MRAQCGGEKTLTVGGAQGGAPDALVDPLQQRPGEVLPPVDPAQVAAERVQLHLALDLHWGGGGARCGRIVGARVGRASQRWCHIAADQIR